MIEGLSSYLVLLFVLLVLLTIGWIYLASKSKSFLFLAIAWTILQSFLGYKGVYQNTELLPPRIMLFGVLPALIMILITFLLSKGRLFIDRIDLKSLTYFHLIRIPVEVFLYVLYKKGHVPVNITFEGSNFDILSGLTAPLIAYLAFSKKGINKGLFLVWNIFCLLLLFNVVITAILAIPSPYQKIAFDQPNIAVLYFPFNLLPVVIVPIVLFAHLVAFRRLTKTR